VVHGEAAWGRALAQEVLGLMGATQALCLSSVPLTGTRTLPVDRAREALGDEADALVIDLHSPVDPDGLGATAGVVRGGGLVIFLAPAWAAWPRTHDGLRARLAVAPFPVEAVGDRFVRRLAGWLEAAPGVSRLVPDGASASGKIVAPTPQPSLDDPWCRTADQRRAVDAVLRAGRGRARRPAVLTADRGRGKSAALGLAAGALLLEGHDVVLTAPRLDAVRSVFEHAARRLGVPAPKGGRLVHGDATLRFLPPGELMDQRPEARLLLVDEAAALPVPLLCTLLDTYPRVAFATTTHGYEGTGRGFQLRFQAHLAERAPGWRAVPLTTPIRYAAGDPVEALVFGALLLDARPAQPPAEGAVEIVCLDRAHLDERELSDLFGLLVSAHYRTTPNDLMRLLDAPNARVWSLRLGGVCVGAALVNAEGGLPESLCEAIYAGTRRPAGHMLPETLAAHVGIREAPRLRAHRVVRVAVHPEVRRRGLGRQLLDAIADAAAVEGTDYLGSAFGATPELLRFWAGAGYAVGRLGTQRGRSTGERSAVVLRAISPSGRALFDTTRRRWMANLPALLTDCLSDVEPALVLSLARDLGPSPVTPTEDDGESLRRVAAGQCGVETALAAARSLAWSAARDPALATALDAAGWATVVRRLLQGRPAEGDLRGALAALQSAQRAGSCR
jgi:tRNA(Met) cytidine acetyltransferase